MAHSVSIPHTKMIPITKARRNLGELVKRLEDEKELYLVKDGKVAARLSLPEEVKQTRWEKAVDEAFGAWKGTDLDDDKFWEDILVTERVQGTKKKRARL
jgi:antitoxin (DNA-binding transcriptional repressor) of toxin-antitoxin stability system